MIINSGDLYRFLRNLINIGCSIPEVALKEPLAPARTVRIRITSKTTCDEKFVMNLESLAPESILHIRNLVQENYDKYSSTPVMAIHPTPDPNMLRQLLLIRHNIQRSYVQVIELLKSA
jgi:hypothetical protein